MSYENAPATKMLATHCALCSRALVDAVSVETGIGPICRENSGYNVEADPEARATVNAIVYRIAAGMPLDELVSAIETVRSFGFGKLADTLIKAKATITIEAQADGTLLVFTPYDAGFVTALKAASPWRQWEPARKAWIVSNGPKVKNALWAAMRRSFPNTLGVGPQGLFVTPAAR